MTGTSPNPFEEPESVENKACTHCGGSDAECLMCLGGGPCGAHTSLEECKEFEDERDGGGDGAPDVCPSCRVAVGVPHKDDCAWGEAVELDEGEAEAIQCLEDYFGMHEDSEERVKDFEPNQAQQAWATVVAPLLSRLGVPVTSQCGTCEGTGRVAPLEGQGSEALPCPKCRNWEE